MNNAAVLLMHVAPTPKTQPPLLPASAFPHLAPFQERLLSDHCKKSIKQKAIADSLRVAMLVLACNANPQFLVQAHHMHSGEQAVWPASGLIT
jgi:hypothetical protein